MLLILDGANTGMSNYIRLNGIRLLFANFATKKSRVAHVKSIKADAFPFWLRFPLRFYDLTILLAKNNFQNVQFSKDFA